MFQRQFPRSSLLSTPAVALALVWGAPSLVSAQSLPEAPVATAGSGVTAADPIPSPGLGPVSTEGQTSTQQPYQNPLDKPLPTPTGQPPLQTPGSQSPATPSNLTTTPSPLVASLPSPPNEDLPRLIQKDHLGSAYIPVDNIVYPMALRLYSLGYLDTIFIGMRPWTRRSLLHALELSGPAIQADGNEEALGIYAKLMDYLAAEIPGSEGTVSGQMTRGQVYGVESVYTRAIGISGLTLRDSYQLGQTLWNDYGRPYQRGFNNQTGFSTLNEWGRFSLYIRGEYQHAPSGAGYDTALSTLLSNRINIPFSGYNDPQDTIPSGPIAASNPFRLQEAALSFHVLGNEISGGKTDAWLGPGVGGALAWSNNAENIYSFRINRVDPLHIPYFSYLFGRIRYDFFVGSLKGHTDPRDPWVHSEMVQFKPTDNFEFGFQRTVIWGGVGHEPVTLHTFFRSFFSISDTTQAEKSSSLDPGARYSDFNFSWRLPFLRKHVTLYTDSISHDDVTPISAPRRAAYRPGIYLSQFPGIPKLDLRVEAASTDCSTLRCIDGVFNYFEAIQLQGYTNKGFIMGDWVGREAKAGNAWLTYHLSPNEWIQASYLHKKTAKDFIFYGTTQTQFKIDVVKRLRPDIELDAWFQYEHWAAPIYQANQQTDTVTAFKVTFYPKLHSSRSLNGK